MSNKQKIWIAAGGSVVVIIALVLVVASVRAQTNSTSAYQTTTVQLGTLTSTVEGSGTVASTQSVDLAWQLSGQVDQVTGQIGSLVKAGNVLATILPDVQTLNNLESNLVTAQENLAELTSPSSIATAQAAVASAEQALTNAQYNRASLNTVSQAVIDNAYASLVLTQKTLDNATTAYNSIGLPLSDPRKANAYQIMYNAQKKYNTALYNYNIYTGHASQTTIDAADAALAQATANLAEAKNYLAALTGGDVPADATGTSLLKLKEAKMAVQTAQDSLDETKLIALFNGTITQANAIPGAIVSAGTQAFRIDNLSSLVVAVNVTEIDINSIQRGQAATITFDAIPNKTYNGKVINSDLAGSVSANSVNFSVTVQITDADSNIKPGMSANVTIVTNKVANALLVPSTAIFTDTNGQQYVYLIQNGTPTTEAVTVGAVSDSTSQITSNNLKEGDTIILSFASTSTSSSGFGFGGFGGLTGGTRVEQPNQQPVATP